MTDYDYLDGHVQHLLSDVLVASGILIGEKCTFKTSGKPCGDRISIMALTYVLSMYKI